MKRLACALLLSVGCLPGPATVQTVTLPRASVEERCAGVWNHVLDLVLIREVLRTPNSDIPTPEVLLRALDNLDVEYQSDGTADRFVTWCLEAKPNPIQERCMLQARTLSTLELCTQ